MAKSSAIRYASDCPLESVKARLFLFAGLIAIALVHAWPDRAEEQALIGVGQRLCGTAVNGTPIHPRPDRSQEKWTSSLTGLIENLPSRLRDDRLKFNEGCHVRVMRGHMGLYDSDYLLRLSDGEGGWVMLILNARSFYPTYGFEVEAVGSGWITRGPS